jgi:putative transposase
MNESSPAQKLLTIPLLNKTPFLCMGQPRVDIAARVEDHHRKRPHLSLGYETRAAFAADMDTQWPPSTALMRNKAIRL